MSIKIYPYKQGSRSARALADTLGGRVLRLQGSTYRYRERDTIINWGNSTTFRFDEQMINFINKSHLCRGASNKLSAFTQMSFEGVQIPEFWTNREEIPDDAFPIVCRTILNGHSGAGIVIANNRGEIVNAPLYVKYMKKRDEYRIHAGLHGIISIQRKATRNGEPPLDTRIRNHNNGYVFIRGDVAPPEQVIEQARFAVNSLGLDFGAVDIIYNHHYQLATVLEVNTAPGLEGQTVIDYANYFREHYT
jgi:glutathione synthase/RimK-type ligase-like ATP-grasp enzyme